MPRAGFELCRSCPHPPSSHSVHLFSAFTSLFLHTRTHTCLKTYSSPLLAHLTAVCACVCVLACARLAFDPVTHSPVITFPSLPAPPPPPPTPFTTLSDRSCPPLITSPPPTPYCPSSLSTPTAPQTKDKGHQPPPPSLHPPTHTHTIVFGREHGRQHRCALSRPLRLPSRPLTDSGAGPRIHFELCLLTLYLWLPRLPASLPP